MSSNETKIYIALFVTIGIVALFLIFFIYTILGYHRKYRRLNKRFMLTEMRILENERKRIATDLHDDFGQILSVIKMQLGRINAADNETRLIVQDASLQLNETLARMRTMSEKLLPQAFFRTGSAKSISAYVHQINKSGAMKIHFYCKEGSFFSNKDQELQLFRILQELITNAIKHANASTLDLKVYESRKKIFVISEDNGIGFNQESIVDAADGSGLRNMYHRVELLDGLIFLQTATGMGVKYEIQIPVPYENQKDPHHHSR